MLSLEPPAAQHLLFYGQRGEFVSRLRGLRARASPAQLALFEISDADLEPISADTTVPSRFAVVFFIDLAHPRSRARPRSKTHHFSWFNHGDNEPCHRPRAIRRVLCGSRAEGHPPHTPWLTGQGPSTTYSVTHGPRAIYHILCGSRAGGPSTTYFVAHGPKARPFTTYYVAHGPRAIYHILCCSRAKGHLPHTLWLTGQGPFTTSLWLTGQGSFNRNERVPATLHVPRSFV